MWKGVLISRAFYSLESKRHRRVMGRKNKDPGSYLMLDSLNTLATWVQSFMYIYIIFIFIPFTLLLKSFHWNPNSESSVVFWEQYEFVFESEPKEGVSLSSTSVFTGGATPDWHRDKCVCVVFASVHTGTQYYTCCADTKQDAVCTNSAVHKTVTLSNGLYNTDYDWTFSAASPPVADVWLSAFLCQTAVFTPLNRVFLVLTQSQPIKTWQRRNKTASKWPLTLNVPIGDWIGPVKRQRTSVLPFNSETEKTKSPCYWV